MNIYSVSPAETRGKGRSSSHGDKPPHSWCGSKRGPGVCRRSSICGRPRLAGRSPISRRRRPRRRSVRSCGSECGSEKEGGADWIRTALLSFAPPMGSERCVFYRYRLLSVPQVVDSSATGSRFTKTTSCHSAVTPASGFPASRKHCRWPPTRPSSSMPQVP